MNTKQVLIAVDQLLNTLTGGWADETISARAWRCNSIWAVRFINWIFDTLTTVKTVMSLSCTCDNSRGHTTYTRIYNERIYALGQCS